MPEMNQQIMNLNLELGRVSVQTSQLQLMFNDVVDQLDRMSELSAKTRKLMPFEASDVKEFTVSVREAANELMKLDPKKFMGEGVGAADVFLAGMEEALKNARDRAQEVAQALKLAEKVQRDLTGEAEKYDKEIKSAKEELSGIGQAKAMLGHPQQTTGRQVAAQRAMGIGGELQTSEKLRQHAIEREKHLKKEIDLNEKNRQNALRRLEIAKRYVEENKKSYKETSSQASNLEAGYRKSEEFFRKQRLFDEERRTKGRGAYRRVGGAAGTALEVAGDIGMPTCRWKQWLGRFSS